MIMITFYFCAVDTTLGFLLPVDIIIFIYYFSSFSKKMYYFISFPVYCIPVSSGSLFLLFFCSDQGIIRNVVVVEKMCVC